MFHFRHSDVWKFWNKQNRIMTLAEIDLKIHPWQGNLQWQTHTHTHTHTHTPFYCHCRQMMLQPMTDTSLFVCLYVFVYICAVFLCGVFINQALLNLKIITFMTNQHHRRCSASCAKRKYIQPTREWDKERENDYISIIEQLADRDLINYNLVALVAISGIAMTFSS